MNLSVSLDSNPTLTPSVESTLGIKDINEINRLFTPIDAKGFNYILEKIVEKIRRVSHFIMTGVWVNYHNLGQTLNEYRFKSGNALVDLEKNLGQQFIIRSYRAAMKETGWESFSNGLKFLWRFIKSPITVGSLLPSSNRLGRAIVNHVPCKETPGEGRHYLEIGPGTGRFTYQLITTKLRDEDHLDVVEYDPKFVKILQKRFGHLKNVNIIQGDITAFKPTQKYDYCISGLPLAAFPLSMVQNVYKVFSSVMKKDKELAYFEYLGIPKIKKQLLKGEDADNFAKVLDLKQRKYVDLSGSDEKVWLNVTPARVCRLKF